MKKSTKTSIVTGVIIVVIGVVVWLCAMGMAGWNFKQVNEWREKTYYASADITKLNIKVNWGYVVINRSDTGGVSVKYEFDDRYAPNFEEKDGKLIIETSSKRWYEFSYWFQNAPRLEITVPQDADLSEIRLTLNAGTVQLGDGDWGKLIDVELNAGTISVGNVTVDDLNVDVNAGAFDAKNLDCDSVTCNIRAGAFNAKEIICRQFECDLNAGAANVKRLCAYKIKVDVSAGGVDLGLVGPKSSYNVRVDKSAGSCNVTSQTNASATRTLDIDVSAGSCNVTFGK